MTPNPRRLWYLGMFLADPLDVPGGTAKIRRKSPSAAPPGRSRKLRDGCSRRSGGEGSLGAVNGRGEPNGQPISMLATIASLIDGGLADSRDHYAMLLKARPKPFVLDDATIADTKRVNGEGLEWCDVYDRQLQRWRSERLTGAQQREVARAQGVSGELRVELTRILELADELAQGTIERQLAKSDLELALEHLSRPDPRT